MPAGETTLDHAYQKDVPQLRSWWHYIKKRNIVFGIVVFGLGLGSYFAPIPFGLKGLLSGAIIGAGVAAILTEFTFAFERRESDESQRILNQQNENLIQRIDILKSYIAKSQWHQISRLFRLGMNLALIQWQKFDDKNSLLNLAEVLGLREIIEQFVNLPNLQAPQAVSTLSVIRETVELRYPRDGVDAFVAGYALMTWVSMGGPEDDSFEIVRKGLLALDLKVEVKQYVENSLQMYKEGKCQMKNVIYFSSLLGLYISSFTTGSDPDLAIFFEKERSPIDGEATVHRMEAMIQKVADS